MKRFVSLGMAAACALSLAVPAFADETVNKYKDSGYAEATTVMSGKMANATNTDTSFTVSGVSGLKSFAVDISTCKNQAQVAKKVAAAIDKKDGYDVEILFGGTMEEWNDLQKAQTVIVPNAAGIPAGQYELNVLRKETDIPLAVIPPIEDITLADLFYNEFDERTGDLEVLYGSGVANDDDGVLPDKKLYFLVNHSFAKDTELAIDVKAAEGSKYIKSIKDTTKSFGANDKLFDSDGNEVPLSGRFRVIEIKLKENMTDDEFKVLFDIKIRAKKEVNGWQIGETQKFPDVAETWISNDLWTKGDSDWAAGRGGMMVEPLKNEENEIIWYDENKDLAKVEFYADSDTDKFFVKLSTKWNNEWYSDMFRNTDAFIFNFVGAPKISATSRATLTIYNPFVNEDDELEVDLDELKVYKVLDTAALAATTEEAIAEAIADGRIEDVTNLFTAGENEDGDQVLTTRTRDLGTYIVTTATPADLVDSDNVVDSTNTGKVNPGTGC